MFLSFIDPSQLFCGGSVLQKVFVSMCTARSGPVDEFLLQGTQVNFIQRSQPKDRKNCHNSIMSSRPYSAVSNQRSYKKENSLKKRPLSADTIFCTEKKFDEVTYDKLDRISFRETLSTKENIDIPNLPSSEILKSLLSEPLGKTWNSNTEKVSPHFDDSNSIDSEKSLGTKIQEFVKRSSMERGVLLPGIKTKPPLPERARRKFENYPPDEMSSIRINLFQPNESAGDFAIENNERFENNYDICQVNCLNSVDELNNSCFLEDLEEMSKSVNCNENKENTSITSEMKIGEDLSNTSFRNWLQENNALLLNETIEYENQTDKELDNLRKQQEDLSESFHSIDTIFENTENVTNKRCIEQEDNRPANSTNYMKNNPNDIVEKPNKISKSNNIKLVNKNEPIKTNLTNKSSTIIPKDMKKQPKSILKAGTRSRRDSPVEQNHKVASIQKKIELKPCNQYRTETIDDNVKSWMSTNGSHENFLDFLNKLDNLEQPEANDDIITENDEHVPERDTGIQATSDYDDIASILEVLEKEDLKSQKSIESLKEIINNELADSNNLARNYETRSSSTSSLASSNYNEVLSYLDEVDQNCVKTLKTAKDRVRTVTKITNAAISVDNIPKLEDLLSYSNVELAHYVVDISLRYKEKSSCTSVLQTELSKFRNLLNTKTDEFEKSIKQKLRVQKEEYEGVIKRHQKFIDQLIADKKQLNVQCEGLISEMKVLEDRFNTNTRATEQRHKIELQKAKDMHMAAEKMRRDKWIEGKTQRIKEMTVKSLEPELQNMASRQQHELSDLRSLHKRELEDLELRAARKTQQQCEALRQQLTTERETAIAHERDILRQRLEKLVESEEKGYQEQRRRLNAEHASRTADCEQRITAMAGERDRSIEAMKVEYEDKLQNALRRHKTELKNVRETNDLEFEVWKNNYKKQQSIKFTEIESQMRDMCKKERDREIEIVIERLEQEATDTKEQTEQAAENRLRRMKETYEGEIKDLEKSSNEYKGKYSVTKEKLLKVEDTVINLSTSLKQLQNQLQQAKEVTDRFTMDKNQLKELIKEEFLSDIQSLENEVKLLKTSKDDDIHKIFSKVKLTVAHKDELLSELTKTNTNLHEKCTLLENLLEQQRKDYLIK